jgi:hypothetical protein
MSAEFRPLSASPEPLGDTFPVRFGQKGNAEIFPLA